jgi:hypothetical protein
MGSLRPHRFPVKMIARDHANLLKPHIFCASGHRSHVACKLRLIQDDGDVLFRRLHITDRSNLDFPFEKHSTRQAIMQKRSLLIVPRLTKYLLFRGVIGDVISCRTWYNYSTTTHRIFTRGFTQEENMKANMATLQRQYRKIFLFILALLCIFLLSFPMYARGESKSYVGAETCKGCHEKEYTSFVTHSKMSKSFSSIARMRKGLTAEEMKKCYECHTTGYGKPGGFQSETATPDLKNLGCEACHGPGSGHASSGNPKEIKRHLSVKDCESCHAQDRVAAFNFKPLMFGGAH